MLTNATVLRIDSNSGADATGSAIRVIGAAIAVRCFVDAVSNSQRWSLGVTSSEVTQAAYIEKAQLVAAGLSLPGFAAGDKLLIAIDGEDPTGTLQAVVTTKDRQMGALAHFEVFLKPV